MMSKPSSKHDAFSRFFSETYQSLRRYALRLTGSPCAAEDIVQEAYVRTYQQGERVERPQAFLFVTVRNLAYNQSRQARVAPTDLVGDIDDVGVYHDGGRSPEDGLIAGEEARLLQQAVARLSPQCRAVFTMKLFQGYSYKQIAKELGISTKTVEKHISKALRETHAYMHRQYGLVDKESASDE
ncbi:sigma-70 family RNA polymerase sigma factor [Luteimonas sp. RD2P54]|uniref:Sigma-70 family RNA polymerase sigma factor n=1 Tax=Luteimonas endophytica TaxID=3042023 RepID=A0ABT6JAQ0_9GAMM|nr:sigma-70 family RNA polymerase sigma factor [Luteimonas endophytica]MDH5823908.1 sigma-70 family RNA polymerase sigma factor [Luteimonas endophytica]